MVRKSTISGLKESRIIELGKGKVSQRRLSLLVFKIGKRSARKWDNSLVSYFEVVGFSVTLKPFPLLNRFEIYFISSSGLIYYRSEEVIK
jgi:hypothetical protein